MIKRCSLESGIPASFIGNVLHNYNLKMVIPLWMGRKDGISGRSAADSACNVVVGLDQGIDNVGSQKGIGPRKKN